MATPTVELLKRAFSNSRDSPMVPRGTQSPTRLTAIPDALGAMIIPTPGLRSSLLKCTQVQQLYLHHTAPYCYVNTYASHYRRLAGRWHKRGGTRRRGKGACHSSFLPIVCKTGGVHASLLACSLQPAVSRRVKRCSSR